MRRSFFQNTVFLLFALFIWAVWYNHASLPLSTVVSPVVSPTTKYVETHYTMPLADYYTTGEGQSPIFWPTIAIIFVTVIFFTWRVLHYTKRWRKRDTVTVSLLWLGLLPVMLGADEPPPPKKVETSVGIYNVNSKDDLLKFSAEDIRKLVKMENDRTRGAGKTPHPILVYCFEERSFPYTGGKYDNAEIKYRLHVPQNIVPGKKYPLVVHLHGVGEAGTDNTFSLAHLHSILPLMVGPEQQDFFLLVLQCPLDNRVWTFKPEKDGNLDVVLAATEHVTKNNPIDKSRLSLFGLSSGGYGVWQLLIRNPDQFAAAVPVSCSATFSGTSCPSASIWTFHNKQDGGVDTKSLSTAMNTLNRAGGYMKITQFDQGGHAAWRPAMDECNCFAWMIAQKRGGWFNPPPERQVYQGRSLQSSFFAFFLPLLLASGLFVFQKSPYCERMHQRIAETLYRSYDNEEEYDDNDDDDDETETETVDEFRILTDITGTKKIRVKIIGFQGDSVKIQSPEGKVATTSINRFSATDQELMRKMQDGFLAT
ncbi:MAG: prolyl oligopeptidase family serine peptidase [Thermoguttaceae bacterium]